MADSKHLAARSPLISLLGAALLLVTTLASANTVTIKVGDSRREASRPTGAFRRLSARRPSAGSARRARQSVRIVDSLDLPEGTLIDFYKVRNSSEPAERARFEGRGRLVDAFSYLGKHYREVLFAS
jgi:hypothetical protein